MNHNVQSQIIGNEAIHSCSSSLPSIASLISNIQSIPLSIDFSGVRIHTGATAQSMTSNIHAQAFAHGNDIYFNEGKFSPQTSTNVFPSFGPYLGYIAETIVGG